MSESSLPKILVADDDLEIQKMVKAALQAVGANIVIADNGEQALEMLLVEKPDLVILDVIMPGMDGYTVCKEMRGDMLLQDIPILFLTAKAKEEDRITGFEAGADDYLGKPFNIDELILRVKAILRRTNMSNTPSPEATNGGSFLGDLLPRIVGIFKSKPKTETVVKKDHRINIGEYTLDTRTFELNTPHAGSVLLTPVQYDLLYHLMNHPGHVFSPSKLLEEVWDYPSDSGSPDLVRVHIKNLRQRVEADPREPSFIRTVPGYGYTVGEVED